MPGGPARRRPQGGAHIERVAGTASSGALLLDLGDDVCVEPEAGGEREPAVISPAQTDGALRAVAEQLQEVARGFDSVVGHAERSGEHVGASARHHGQRGRSGVDSIGEHAVDDLVHRAVAAEHDHEIGARARCVEG